MNERYSEIARLTELKNHFWRLARTRGRIIIAMGIAIGALLVVAYGGTAEAAEVSSIRDSQYEWVCEDDAGNHISGHTRQDKAFQSCMNKALETGGTYFVRGGAFRVTASGADSLPTPPTDPVDPPPPDPTPGESPLASFGPVTAPLLYPANIGALKQDHVRWEITFTANSLQTGGSGAMGLASRDQTSF